MKTIQALVVLTLLALPAAAGVIIVDASGGGQFTNLQVAVNAAQEGDTLLVKGGAYSSFTIDNKSLVVVAETGATVSVYGSVVVQNLAPDRTVVLARLPVNGANTSGTGITPGVGLYVHHNLGPVRVQACQFIGAPGLDSNPGTCVLEGHFKGWQGAYVDQNPAGVAFVACIFVGGQGWSSIFCPYEDYPTPDGGDGLLARDTLVALHDCSTYGGRGGDLGYGGLGGAGSRATMVTLTSGVIATGTLFNGGNGGNSYDYIPGPGPGGHGLVVGTGTVSWLLDNTYGGGQGGIDIFGGHGTTGQGLSGSGQVFYFSPPRLRMSAPTPVREMTSALLTFSGAPGSRVYLVTTSATAFLPMASWKGVLLTESPNRSRVLPMGIIPGSGTLSVSIPIPDMGPGFSAETRFLQAYLEDGAGGVQLGSFAALTILDSAY